MYVIRRDVFGRFFPGWEENALAEPLEIAVLGTLVLIDLAAVRAAGLADSLLAPRARCAAGSSASPTASAFGSPTSWSGTPAG